jgi:predicted ATP-grasp superfamily ATP-dependent carboligase
MASLFEHAEAIKDFIERAQADGFEIEVSLSYDNLDGTVVMVEVDLWDNRGDTYVNVFTEDRS